MDPCKKNYSCDEFDANNVLKTFFSAHVPYSIVKESTINVMRTFYKAFSTGMVTGRTVNDFSGGPIFYHLLSVKDFVEKITILKLNDASLKELEKWKNRDADTFDWAHATEHVQELTGNSEELEDKEESLRGKIDKILKWNLSKDDPAEELALPKADIAISIVLLEMISKDADDYTRNLRQIAKVINPGGYLLLYSSINASYFKFGEDTFHILPCDESFYKKVILEEGFEIKHLEKFNRKMITDAVDHEGMIFIIAQKVKEQ